MVSYEYVWHMDLQEETDKIIAEQLTLKDKEVTDWVRMCTRLWRIGKKEESFTPVRRVWDFINSNAEARDAVQFVAEDVDPDEFQKKAILSAINAILPRRDFHRGKKDVYFHGLGTVGQIDRAVTKRFCGCGGLQLVASVLELIDGFAWLDEPTGWFRIRSIAKHGLPKTIEKM